MSGNEFSAVAGLTYNFKNAYTDYQNGMDFHVDWGASHFFDNKLQLGVVGYYVQQVTSSEPLPRWVASARRIAGGRSADRLLFPDGRQAPGIRQPEGLPEFAAQNRPEGWNAWLTFAISPSAPKPASAKPITRNIKPTRTSPCGHFRRIQWR